MRLLNKTEKNLCSRILKETGHVSIGKLIEDHLEGVRVSLILNPKKATIYFNLPPTKAIHERVFEVYSLIFTTVSLLELLDKEGYILIYQISNMGINEYNFGKGETTHIPTINYPVPDDKIIDLLTKYFNKEVIITDEFMRFCKRGFIARDEQRFQRQISVTTSALVVAIIALTLNTFFNLSKGRTPEIISNKYQGKDTNFTNLNIRKDSVLRLQDPKQKNASR